MAEATATGHQTTNEEKQQHSDNQDKKQPSGNQEKVEHSEGVVARTIEQQTAKLPSDVFLWSALGAIGVSLCFELTGNEEKARFVGQWVSPFLLLGLYNKVVKVAGSDRLHN